MLPVQISNQSASRLEEDKPLSLSLISSPVAMLPVQISNQSASRLEEDKPLSLSLISSPVRESFNGTLLVIGLGTIGLGVIPLLLKHLDFSSCPGGASSAIRIITGPDRLAQAKDLHFNLGISYQIVFLTESNFTAVLDAYRLGDEGKQDLILNLSVDVSSCALLAYCHDHGVLYCDTVTEPWEGVYYDPTLSLSARSNYAMREDALVLKRKYGPASPTAVITCGANPGLVSFFVKEALLELKREGGDKDGTAEEKKSAPGEASAFAREDWAHLAMDLGLQSVHIAERDTQFSAQRKAKGEFVNTWSVDGFLSEGNQPAELGWGTHEKVLPSDACEHDFGPRSAILLKQPGASTLVRSWTPQHGPFHGFVITHSESISIATYLTLFSPEGELAYRPTVHYSYLPCDDAILSLHELRGNNYAPPTSKRTLMEDIVGGGDELGVLLMGQQNGGQPWTYWFGSQLSAADAQQRAPNNSATSLQVTSTIVGALLWALRNPRRGIVEPEELPHEEMLDFVRPYIAPVVGVHTSWTPLAGRGRGGLGLFEETLDEESPFQFSNVRV